MRIEFVAVLVLIAMASIRLLRCFTKKEDRIGVCLCQPRKAVSEWVIVISDSDRFLESQN